MDFYILDKNEICIGTLTTEGYNPQVYSAKYTEKINDMKTLELELANISTIPYDSLKEENYIVFQQEQIEWDMFIIKRVEEVHGVDHTISVYAEHCSQELLDDFCRYEIKDKNYSPSYLLNAVLDGTRWQVWEVDNPSQNHACTTSTLNQSVLQAVQSIRAEYNLNLDFKIDFEGNQVVRRKVFLKTTLGEDNNKTFEYSKDIDSITREVDTADLKTAIIPIGGVPDQAPDNTPPVGIKGITWTTPTNPLNKPSGEDFLEDRAATDLWGYGVSGSRKRPRYVYWENTEIKDSTTLINEAYKLLLTLSVPKVNYKMSVIDLLAISGYDYKGYAHEKVNFGDTVNVIDREFNPPLIIKTQVISREIDLLHPENPTIELGTLIRTVADGTMSNSIGSTNSMSNQIQIIQNSVGTMQSSKADVETLNAETARIDNLISSKANITDLQATNLVVTGKADITSLNTEKARIDTLNANLTTTNNLVANKADITSLNTQTARIDTLNTNLTTTNNLVATKADITALNTQTARIDTLNTNLTTTNNLVATKADITALNTEKARIDTLNTNLTTTNNLVANKAAITDLTASNGRITTLESTTASINNIVNGNITSANMKAGAIKAGDATISDGAIGNAHISSLQADKLTSGTVDTSKVVVQGSNGRLKIQNNKLQVTALNGQTEYERVSLGDVNGDGTVYGLRVRGADGTTVLLDETGVKSEGITNGAIKDSHINSGANIDGSKLNIASVVTSVNNGSTNIQGNKIAVNNSTLDVQFSNIQNTQNSQGTTISNHTSQITQMNNDISLKVSTQDYNTRVGAVEGNVSALTTRTSTSESNISVLQGQITSKVTQTDINNSINNIQLGGRNYFLNSEFIQPLITVIKPLTTTPWQTRGSYTCSIDTSNKYKDKNTFKINAAVVGVSGTHDTLVWTSLRNVATSVNIKATMYLKSTNGSLVTYRLGGGTGNVANKTTQLTANTWTKVEVDLVTNGAQTTDIGFIFWLDKVDTLWVALPMLEISTKASEWQPAPEDMQGQMDSTTTRMTTAESNITQLSNSISLKVDTSTFNTYTSTNDSNISSLDSRLDSAELKITDSSIVSTVRNSTAYTSDLSAKANQTDLSTTNTNVTTAQSTANAAQTLASAKKRVFTSTPTVPYDLGDTWVTTDGSGDLMVCKVARSSGSYTASEWAKGVKYTDDTTANNVQNNLNTTNSNVTSLTTRVSTAESTITQHTNDIALRVTTTTYNSGMATKEGAITKATTAPTSPTTNQLWLDTSVTPNLLKCWSGSAWVKATPSTASEVGAYSSASGSALETRMSAAEVKITDSAIVSTVRSSANYTGDLAAKTDKTAIISTINQTAEAIKISASKIDITGAVTFSSLDSSTQTKVTNGDTANTTVNANKTTWDTASTNATTALNGTAQYRTTGVPTNNPVPSTITTTTNTNGTVNYKLGWNQYTQGTNKADLLLIFWRKDSTTPTVNDSSVSLNVNTTGASYYMFEGVNPADTFSFGIAAARKTENGLEIGAIQCPTTTPDWLGVTTGTPNFTGNVNGTVASTVVTNASNGNTAYSGTSQYRTTGVPTNNPTPTTIAITTNSNGTCNIRLDWGQYTQGTNKADFIMLFWNKTSIAPTVNDSSITFNVNTTGAAYYIFEGVNPADTYTFGIASARKTENGTEVGAIQCPTTTPDWLGVTSGTPNFTGNLNGTSASTVVTNASNGNTANSTITTYKPNWDDAKAKIDLWKHATDNTKIDGGDIYTGTITANSIAAGTITSNLIATTGIVADKIVGGTLTLGGTNNTSGLFQLKNNSNVVTTTIDKNGIVTTGGASGSSAIKLYDGYMYLQDTYGGSAVGQYISATDHYSLGYCANAILSSGSTNALDTSNTKAPAGAATRVKFMTQWFNLSVPIVAANSFAAFDNLVLSSENYVDGSWVVYASASSLAHEFVPSVVNWANGTSGYLGKVSLRMRNVSGASTSATTVKVCVMLAVY